MKLLYCSQCQDVLNLIEKKHRTCSCGKSSGRIIDSVSHITGEFSVTMDMPMENFTGLLSFFQDKDVVRKKKKDLFTDEDKLFCIQVIKYLNEKAGTNFYCPFPGANVTLIMDRKKEQNLLLNDFYGVIDKKCKEWIGTNFQIHLNPTTLFSKKHFSTYLGQLTNVKGTTSQFGEFASAVNSAKR